MGWDGFVSYSHAADGVLAPRLQRALGQFAKPWWRRRSLSIFRDQTGLSANPHLWTSIAAAMDESRYFILLASPEAAASEWVGREIEHWVNNRGSEHMLIAVTAGTFVWDRARNDIDFTASSAAHPALAGVFAAEPRHVDLAWAHKGDQVDERDGRFRDAVADLAATMHGKPKDDLVGDDIRQHRRTIRLAWTAAGALAALTVAAISAGAIAVSQRNEARDQRQQTVIQRDRADQAATEAQQQATRADQAATEAQQQANRADARGLAAQATALSSTNVDVALLLAVEGYRRDASLDTESGLLTALNDARYLVGYHRSLPLDVDDIALTPDGTNLIVLTYDGELRRYDTSTWQQVGDALATGVENPYAVQVSRDGRYVSYGASDGVTVVELATGDKVGAPFGPANGIQGSFSDDGSTIVTVSADEPAARVFDIATRNELGSVAVDGGFALADVRPGHDTVLVVAWGNAPTLQQYHFDGTPAGDPVTLDGMGGLLGSGFSKDGTLILVYDNNAVGQLVDADTMQRVGPPFTVRGSRAGDVSWTPDGTRVAVAADDGSIRVLANDGTVLTTISGLTGAPFIEFLDDHRLLAATNSQAAEYDLRRTTELGTTSDRAELVYDVVPIDGGRHAIANQAQRVVELSADLTEGPIDITPPDARAVATAVSPDGTIAAICTFTTTEDGGAIAAGFINVVDLPSGASRRRFPLRGPDVAFRMVFSPDASRLAVGTRGGALAIFDTTSGEAIVPATQVDSGALRALVWSPDGSVLYGGGQDGVLRFYDPSTGTPTAEVSLSPTIALTDVDPVPDTTLLAVASELGEVFFVDTATGAQSGERLTSGGTQLQGLAITPDGTRIAAISRDGAVRLWDRATGRAVGPPLRAHDVLAGGITFLDTGTRLLTGGFDNTIVSWDLDPQSWLDRACELAGRNLSRAEWDQYLPGKEYRTTCPAFAAG